MNDASLVEAPAVATEQSLAAEAVLDQARVRRAELDLGYAGAVTPPQAWALVRQGAAQLIDVRTAPEFKFVGHVPQSVNVEWRGGDVDARAQYVRELHAAVRGVGPLLLLCRSGVRSHSAALATTAAGYQSVFNVLEGFEGQRDCAQQRGSVDGWRKHGLPWVQD